jgi:hypothetical protein
MAGGFAAGCYCSREGTMAEIQRGKRIAPLAVIASAGFALAGVVAGCGTPAAAVPHRPAAPARSASAPAQTATRLSASHRRMAEPPKYFIDDVLSPGSLSGGSLQVRLSSTGKLTQETGVAALSFAPLGSHGAFVVAQLAGNRCATRFYRTNISATGQLGKLSRLGRTVHGEVVSVAASADGKVIGYFAWPCSKSATGYLAVLHVRIGQVRRWGDVGVYGSAGDMSAGGGLSLSADGGLASFAGDTTTASGTITGQGIWLLRTSSAAGPLAERSRLVLSKPNSGPALSSVVLSPDGRALYLCTVTTRGTTQVADITARRASNGDLTSNIAKLTATHVTFQGLGCPMAMTSSGRYLLVPYALRYARTTTTGPLIQMARLDVAARSVATISFRLPGSAGMSVASGISVAW